MSRILVIIALGCWVAQAAVASANELGAPLPTIAEKTRGYEKHDGYFDFYWDARGGKIWLEINRWQEEFLYLNSLATGVGSNDIGLDRGQLGRTRVVRFERSGPKVLLIQSNMGFRADSDNTMERRAVRDAFAESVLWGFEVAAEDAGRVLVDASNFFLSDAHRVVQTLAEYDEGEYALEASRSAFYLPRTRNFPQNTEVEVTLTFTSDAPGPLVSSVTPSPETLSVRQHHSLVQLPDAGYRPRHSDPRAGYYSKSYLNYAAALSEPVETRLIGRHRLQKINPGAAPSEVVEPIVYYLDSGTPEPVRSALLDGARWWAEAFEAAGFLNAFEVKLLPVDADPMDVRYNVINWVHRSTRGWSYGYGVTDPRTGEIIKGHVTLGSLRVRQDMLIAQGLLAPFAADGSVDPRVEAMGLARLRQLSAHEVGHTLGLTHNYATSASGRSSVMDYPHPLIRLGDDGELDFSQAYGSGIGAWDKVAIAYGYSEFDSTEDEAAGLKKILRDSIDGGMRYIAWQDAGLPGGAHPVAHVWDNGADPIEELGEVMKVRAYALGRFSEQNIPLDAPMASLEETLAPLYYYHRYQVQAVAKILGGMDYNYAVRGDGQTVTEIVSAPRQRAALDALIETLQPDVLALEERILRLIAPRSLGLERGRETFTTRSDPVFDPVAAAEAAADHTIGLILHPARVARLVQFHVRNDDYPSLEETIERLLEVTWKSERERGYHGEIGRAADQVLLYHLFRLAANPDAAIQARAVAESKLGQLMSWLNTHLKREQKKDAAQGAHMLFAISSITRFLENPAQFELSPPAAMPDGSPI
jgi:hypothetical protein